MGFCLFANVAIAARHALDALGCERVLVLDWDVHHGNGTQAIFDESPEVLFVSLHQWPFWPGTGALADSGSGPGQGFTINLPVPAGSGEDEWLGLVEHVAMPAARAFEPDLILVSAGFDAHRGRPAGGVPAGDRELRAPGASRARPGRPISACPAGRCSRAATTWTRWPPRSRRPWRRWRAAASPGASSAGRSWRPRRAGGPLLARRQRLTRPVQRLAHDRQDALAPDPRREGVEDPLAGAAVGVGIQRERLARRPRPRRPGPGSGRARRRRPPPRAWRSRPSPPARSPPASPRPPPARSPRGARPARTPTRAGRGPSSSSSESQPVNSTLSVAIARSSSIASSCHLPTNTKRTSGRRRRRLHERPVALLHQRRLHQVADGERHRLALARLVERAERVGHPVVDHRHPLGRDRACWPRSRCASSSELVISRVARRMIQRLAHRRRPALLVAVADVRHVGRVEAADDLHRRACAAARRA